MNKCKYCKNSSKSFYCSEWCKEQNKIEKRNLVNLSHKCLICGEQTKRITNGEKEYSNFYKYCEMCRFEKRYRKVKLKEKHCFECGIRIDKGRKCDVCIEKSLQRNFDYKNETGVVGKCLNCGDDVIGYIHKKYQKKFCNYLCCGSYNNKKVWKSL